MKSYFTWGAGSQPLAYTQDFPKWFHHFTAQDLFEGDIELSFQDLQGIECAPYILPDLPLARPGAALQDQYRASVLGQAYNVSSFKIVWTCISTAWTPQSGKATCRKGNKERYAKTDSHPESSWSTSGL